MTKVDVITGILGCGKTTFIRSYARYLMQRGLRIAILENDFGAVNVDMMMLQDLKGENCQLEMIAGGCDADCHKRRFKTQMIALGMQHFDRVLIEPSGIYDMDEFFDTLYESPLDKWFEIGSVISIADACLPESLSEQMEYLLASEVCCCGTLLVSKWDGAEPEAALRQRISARLNMALSEIRCSRQFQPQELVTTPWDALTDAEFERISASGWKNPGYVKKFSRDSIESGVHYFMHIAIPPQHIPEVIQGILADESCGSVFRIKGSLPGNPWLKINAADGQLELSPVSDGQAVLIVIGENLNRPAIDAHFLQYNTDSAYTSI